MGGTPASKARTRITAGQAESFRNTASVSGSVDTSRVYLTPDNTANKVELASTMAPSL